MNAIRIRTRIDSDTLHLPELRELIGKSVEIIVIPEALTADGAAPSVDCFENLPPACLDTRELESMRGSLTDEQYHALLAIASQGGPDVDSIARLRAASMI